jgi:hypothetical protein
MSWLPDGSGQPATLAESEHGRRALREPVNHCGSDPMQQRELRSETIARGNTAGHDGLPGATRRIT